MITTFGKVIRKIRIDRNELLYSMAKKLNMSSAELSGMENGRTPITETIKQQIKQCYDLNNEELNELLGCTMEQ